MAWVNSVSFVFVCFCSTVNILSVCDSLVLEGTEHDLVVYLILMEKVAIFQYIGLKDWFILWPFSHVWFKHVVGPRGSYEVPVLVMGVGFFKSGWSFFVMFDKMYIPIILLWGFLIINLYNFFFLVAWPWVLAEFDSVLALVMGIFFILIFEVLIFWLFQWAEVGHILSLYPWVACYVCVLIK